MTPVEYEMCVAEYFRLKGHSVRRTPASNDYGVDVFAEQGSERLALQVKMYGDTSRLVNRDVVMHLHGAKDYFDCTRAVLVTDGMVMEDATRVAQKLGIEVLTLQPGQLPRPVTGAVVSPPDKVAFDAIWSQYLIPLSGLVLQNSRGGSNTLLRVDWSGVDRETQNGRAQFIPIGIFRKAVAELLAHGCVTKDYINQMFPQRASSGILLILSQVPLFEPVAKPAGLKLRSTAHQQLAAWGITVPA